MSEDVPPGERRRRDPDETRRDIITIGLEEFAAHGLAGARVDVIAARTRTTKRMIYYYFKDKEGLYRAVLEAAYTDIRQAEEALDLAGLTPPEAIRALVEFSFDYHESHTDFTRLVRNENVHDARLLRDADLAANLNRGVLARLDLILEEGWRRGEFARRAAALDVHMLISAFCFYRISNEHTFGLIHGVALREPATRAHHRKLATDMVLCYLATPATDEAAAEHLAAGRVS